MATATTTRKSAPAKATKRTAAPAPAASAPAPAAAPAPEVGTVLAILDYVLKRNTKSAHAYEVSAHVDGTEGLLRTMTQYLDHAALNGAGAPRKIRVYVEVVE